MTVHILKPKAKDLGGFTVRRVLPQAQRRHVGPFVFLDEMGPATFGPGQGIDVRPHPHVCLATITFLFDGEILHQDTTGAVQPIRPGDVNWMHAGRGIVHSERVRPEVRAAGQRMHGLQAWVAVPEGVEDSDPYFDHQPASALPKLHMEGADLTVIAGRAYGQRAPTRVESQLFYVNAQLSANARLALPHSEDHEERGAYVVQGPIVVDGQTAETGEFVVFSEHSGVAQAGDAGAHLMLMGGVPLGERFMEWNFVSSRKERLAQAREDWNASAQANWQGTPFTLPEGDNQEYIPFPGTEFSGVVEPTEDCPFT